MTSFRRLPHSSTWPLHAALRTTAGAVVPPRARNRATTANATSPTRDRRERRQQVAAADLRPPRRAGRGPRPAARRPRRRARAGRPRRRPAAARSAARGRSPGRRPRARLRAPRARRRAAACARHTCQPRRSAGSRSGSVACVATAAATTTASAATSSSRPLRSPRNASHTAPAARRSTSRSLDSRSTATRAPASSRTAATARPATEKPSTWTARRHCAGQRDADGGRHERRDDQHEREHPQAIGGLRRRRGHAVDERHLQRDVGLDAVDAVDRQLHERRLHEHSDVPQVQPQARVVARQQRAVHAADAVLEQREERR